jgi:2'-hydroxyisoflavone reductase
MIGGTRFLGKALVEAAIERNHQVTLLNRGQSNPQWFPEVEKITGDRNLELGMLANRRWQAVIDVCAYLPRQVRALLTTLGDSIQHYTLISTISVYADFSQPGLDEQSPLATISNPDIEEITGETYGALKVLCENAAEAGLPGRVLTIRPGLIVGPFDVSDRFTYWPVRVSKGGEVLCPDTPEWRTQIIDVRDLASWTLDMIEKEQIGIFNATGPAQPLPFGEVLETSRRLTNSEAYFTWVDTQFLLDQKVEPWSDLPLWLPGPENTGADQVSIEKALRYGLTFRSLDETIRDTLAWEATRPAGHAWRAGLDSTREAELLDRFKSQQGQYE